MNNVTKFLYLTLAATLLVLGYPSALAAQTISITSPSSGTIAYRGYPLQVQFQANPSITNLALQAGFPNGWSAQPIGPGTFVLTIPANTPIDQYQVYVSGLSGSALVSSSPITVNVDTPTTINSVTTKPETVQFDAIGDSLALQVWGTLSDGSTDLVTHSAQVSFSSNNVRVATIDSTGLITAVAPGSTHIAVNSPSGTYNVAVSIATPATSSPTFTPAPGHYASGQSVTLISPIPGAALFYTTNGSLPTPKSNLYSNPIPVAASQTIHALAVLAGQPNSVVSTGVYTIGAITAPPISNPASGTYSTPQRVTLSDPTPGGAIFYTLDGSLPTPNSTVYTAPVSITQTTTLNAVALAPEYTLSPVSTATYTIIGSGNQCVLIDYSKGFSAASSNLTLNGGATLANNALLLTDYAQGEARSAFYSTAVPITTFTTDFTFQMVDAIADGLTFTIQGLSPQALGLAGDGLGYAGISPSAAVKFDLWDNAGEGFDSTGLYLNGAKPTVPALNLYPAGIHLHSGHVFAVHITYSNGLAAGTITDQSTGASGSMSLKGDLSTVLTGPAYVGFTASTGSFAAFQSILTWSYSGGPNCAATR